MISIEIDGIEYRLFDHLFAVSRCGKVLRNFAPYEPRAYRIDGYLTLGRKRLMHRVVATCWLENPENKKHVHHKNGDKADNRADNLEWVTPKEHFSERHDGTCGKYERAPETREKLRQYRLGRQTSEETKAKQRAALIGRKRPYFARAGHSEESKKARSLNHPKNTPCMIFGVTYRSFAEAGKALGIKPLTLRKRCLSKNFPEYEVINPPL